MRARRRGTRVGGFGLALVALLAACGKAGSDHGSGPTTTAASGPVLLRAPAGTDPVTIDAAASGVRTRLERMGVPPPTVTAKSDGVEVSSTADRYQLQAAARAGATTIASVASVARAPGPECRRPDPRPAATNSACRCPGSTRSRPRPPS